MKAEQSYYRVPPLTRIDRTRHVNANLGRNNKIHSLSEYRYLREMEKQLSEREVITRINRQMAAVGLVLIPLAFLLGAACFVAQVGIYMGWW